MTNKLIQELVGLCVEKGVCFQFDDSFNTFVYGRRPIKIDLDDDGAPQQLQSAIEKVKQLWHLQI